MSIDPSVYKDYPHDVKRPRTTTHAVVDMWLKRRTQGKFKATLWYVFFQKEADAIIFRLRFG